jgi:hypothetical protein
METDPCALQQVIVNHENDSYHRFFQNCGANIHKSKVYSSSRHGVRDLPGLITVQMSKSGDEQVIIQN